MSLQDKLNENRNMSELFQETKELNELMKSYIRVHMNKEMAKEVTIHNQLNQIQEKSDKVMSNMQSILNTQGKKLEENAENLQENRNKSEIFQEKKEHNELMKSYIRVHINEEKEKEVTIHNQLNQIQEKSDKVMSNIQSNLNTQGKMLEENAENLQAILIN